MSRKLKRKCKRDKKTKGFNKTSLLLDGIKSIKTTNLVESILSTQILLIQIRFDLILCLLLNKVFKNTPNSSNQINNNIKEILFNKTIYLIR